MNTYLKFDPQFRKQYSQLGISFEWCVSLFLCNNAEFESVPPLLDGISAGQRAFAIRQTLATDIAYTSLRDKRFSCPDPWLAGARCAALVCQTTDRQEKLPFALLPIYYGCKSANGEEFWVCVYGTFGRVTQVFFPNRNLVVFDIFQDEAVAVIGCLQSWLSRHPFNNDAALLAAREGPPARCIGLLDMVTNFGHQAINHLSGVQRVLDFDLLKHIDELWVCGVVFFGQVESLFPELNGRVRYFSNRWDVAYDLVNEPCQVIRIGSTYLPSKLRKRIMRNVPTVESGQRRNMLVVTVRAAGRICVNLPDVIAELYDRLRKTVDFTIAFDGWVIPESVLVTSAGATVPPQYASAIRDEMDLARAIEKSLPRGAVSANTIGRSMFESLNDLSAATCYFAHVGTLQHKLGLLLRLPGVVHGPKLQVSGPEGGPYYSEDGVPPVFIPENAIEDVPTTSGRGGAFADYRIVDLTFTTQCLAGLMPPS